MGILSSIFGSSKVIETGMNLIDDMVYSDQEEAEDKRKAVEVKNKAKIDLMGAYAPFKLAQRYLALMFTTVFLFIMINGVLGTLYGWVDVVNVQAAKDFADEMWLGEIVLAIVGFYFGGGFAESAKTRKDK